MIGCDSVVPVSTTMGGEPRLIGRRMRKHDGDEYLTARATYTGDVALAGMAHAAIVRSPHAHARIVAIDTAAAEADPSVVCVLTGAQAAELTEEIPHSLDPAGLGGNHAVVRCLAHGKVVYAGEPVAAVVAETAGDAALAATRIVVEYEPLPVVLDAEAALADDATLLDETWDSNRIIGGDVGADDFAQAAAGADHVLTGEVRGHRGNAAPIETRTHVADWDAAAGRLTLYATTQNPHPLRSTLAASLRVPESHIHVIAPRMGGSFGLKMYGNREDFLVCLLAMRAGRPVKWVEERSAALLPGTRDQILRYRVAFDADGRLRALDVHAISNHGAAAPGHGWGMAYVGALTTGAGYALEHCHVRYDVVATNKAPWGGTKPFGKDGATLVMERIMERIALTTGLDPAEVRRRNFVAADAFPHVHTSGMEMDSGDYEGVLDLALQRLDYAVARDEQRRLREQGRHLGIGIGFELVPESADIPGALVAGFDTSTVRMNPSGQVTVLTGVTSPGSGNDTGISMLIAEELGVALEDVTIAQGDTERCPYGFGNISSRSIITGGSSAVLAARDIAAKLRTVAATMLHAEEGEEIVLADGMAVVVGDPERHVPLPAVANAVFSLGYLLALGIEPNLESTRTFRPSNIRQIPDEQGRMQPYTTYPFAVHISVAEVDVETGVVTLRRHVVAHDCGTMVNPLMVDGQVTGGAVMGLGAALGEEFTYDETTGVPISDGFKTYLMARACDVPEIELEHQVTPSPVTLLGAKGVGEAGFAGAQAAVLNAVNDALVPLGAALDATPVSAPNVLAAIQAATR
jgi:carbon-monoxide dehydrogenase large subunit